MTTRYATEKRKLPPHGKTVAARLADRTVWPRMAGTSPDGEHLTIWVACGSDAWNYARQRIDNHMIVVTPSGEDPHGFDWRPFTGHAPVLIARCGAATDAEVDALARALIRDGAQRVLDVDVGRRWLARGAS
jgi:hypothetical protein